MKEPLREFILSRKRLRVCLRCDKPFLSEGPHNRLCLKCRSVLNYSRSPKSNYPSHTYSPRKYLKQV